MHRVFLIFLVLIFTQSKSYSQSKTLSTSIAITRFDFFHSFEFEFQPSKFALNVGLGYGVNRSIFQQRFYPRINFGSTYYWLNREKFRIGPSLIYALSFIQLNSSSKIIFWNEANAGLTWSYGNKWKVGQTILVGYVAESHYSTIEKKRTHAGTLSYLASIKLIYEI